MLPTAVGLSHRAHLRPWRSVRFAPVEFDVDPLLEFLGRATCEADEETLIGSSYLTLPYVLTNYHAKPGGPFGIGLLRPRNPYTRALPQPPHGTPHGHATSKGLPTRR